MEEQTHIWNLITRKLSGEATAEEVSELETYLKSHPEKQYAFGMLSEWWRLKEPAQADERIAARFQKLRQQLQLPEKDDVEELPPLRYGFWPRNKWAVAAVALVLVGCAAFFYFSGGRFSMDPSAAIVSEGVMSQVSTSYGSKSKVVLPDGTLVWLNSGSNLTYNNRKFGKESRAVVLVGEAYFEVAHDADHPFIIHAGKINVKVLGTAFDIKSYPSDPTIQATLIRGAIEVSFANQPKKKVRLKPHQTLTVVNNAMMIAGNRVNKGLAQSKNGYTVNPVTVMPEDSTIVETSWVDNKLAFRSEAFPQLARQMERWYNVNINFTDSQVKQYKFTGIFKNESLEQALKALKITAPFNYRVNGDEVYISSIQ